MTTPPPLPRKTPPPAPIAPPKPAATKRPAWLLPLFWMFIGFVIGVAVVSATNRLGGVNNQFQEGPPYSRDSIQAHFHRLVLDFPYNVNMTPELWAYTQLSTDEKVWLENNRVTYGDLSKIEFESRLGQDADGKAVDAADAADFDPTHAVSVADVMDEAAKIRATYGDKLTGLQRSALNSDIASWTAGKVVKIPVVVDNVEQNASGPVVISFTFHGNARWLSPRRNVPVSMPKDKAMLVKLGQPMTAYFSILPGNSAGNAEIQYRTDVIIRLKFLDARE